MNAFSTLYRASGLARFVDPILGQGEQAGEQAVLNHFVVRDCTASTRRRMLVFLEYGVSDSHMVNSLSQYACYQGEGRISNSNQLTAFLARKKVTVQLLTSRLVRHCDDLERAISTGNVDELKGLLVLKAVDINRPLFVRNQTALMLAAQQKINSLDMVDLLYRTGANLKAHYLCENEEQNQCRNTPLVSAFKAGNLDVVDYFLDMIPPKARNCPFHPQMLLKSVAIWNGYGVFRRLVDEAGGFTFERESEYANLFECASIGGNVDIILTLLENGFNPDLPEFERDIYHDPLYLGLLRPHGMRGERWTDNEFYRVIREMLLVGAVIGKNCNRYLSLLLIGRPHDYEQIYQALMEAIRDNKVDKVKAAALLGAEFPEVVSVTMSPGSEPEEMSLTQWVEKGCPPNTPQGLEQNRQGMLEALRAINLISEADLKPVLELEPFHQLVPKSVDEKDIAEHLYSLLSLTPWKIRDAVDQVLPTSAADVDVDDVDV
ncbi:ankyrin repeat domain-containing protein, partial [Sansalvadorimonas verongulae]|uniref:ankyrin repeat domain-containing protein n=1 Tax=Sansalvadorimonas verongulae TaxID=2172824 RepID=UPI0012BCCDB6